MSAVAEPRMTGSRSQTSLTSLASPLGAVAASTPGASPPPMTTRPATVEHGRFRFCVHDAPTDSNLPSYVEYLQRKRVVALVRACEPTYSSAPLVAAGIRVVELPFQDGSPPPDAMVDAWLALVEEVFGKGAGKASKEKSNSAKKDKDGNNSKKDTGVAISVHCVAGLGRAPILVCIALIESGMHWMSAVELVRKKRRGALNLTQLKYLETYKPRGKRESCVIQ